jgi:hypothetical protein
MRDAKTRSVLVIDFKIPIYVVPFLAVQVLLFSLDGRTKNPQV